MRGRHPLLVALLLLVAAAGCSERAAPSLGFPRAGVAVDWTVRTVHGHQQAWVAAGHERTTVRLDRAGVYPRQVVGWRNGDAIHALFVVPRDATVTAERSVVETTTDALGNRVVLATSTQVRRPYARLVVTWPGGRQAFRVGPSAP